jgi:hypothetical protein
MVLIFCPEGGGAHSLEHVLHLDQQMEEVFKRRVLLEDIFGQAEAKKYLAKIAYTNVILKEDNYEGRNPEEAVCQRSSILPNFDTAMEQMLQAIDIPDVGSEYAYQAITL